MQKELFIVKKQTNLIEPNCPLFFIHIPMPLNILLKNKVANKDEFFLIDSENSSTNIIFQEPTTDTEMLVLLQQRTKTIVIPAQYDVLSPLKKLMLISPQKERKTCIAIPVDQMRDKLEIEIPRNNALTTPLSLEKKLFLNQNDESYRSLELNARVSEFRNCSETRQLMQEGSIDLIYLISQDECQRRSSRHKICERICAYLSSKHIDEIFSYLASHLRK
jgi:hypothetical protein